MPTFSFAISWRLSLVPLYYRSLSYALRMKTTKLLPFQVLDGKPLVAGYDDDDVDGVPMPGDHDGMPLDLEALDKQKELEEAERQAKLKFQASKWETVDESTLEAQVRSIPLHCWIKKRQENVRSHRLFTGDSPMIPSKFQKKVYIPRESLSLINWLFASHKCNSSCLSYFFLRKIPLSKKIKIFCYPKIGPLRPHLVA